MSQLSKDLGKAWFKYMLIKGNPHKRFYSVDLKCSVGEIFLIKQKVFSKTFHFDFTLDKNNISLIQTLHYKLIQELFSAKTFLIFDGVAFS